MLVLHTKEVAEKWFGVACAAGGLVATAVSSTRAGTLGRLRKSLPPGVAQRIGDEERSDEIERTLALLVELEANEEGRKRFALDPEYVAEPLASVLKVAAAIPLGYVTSYGNIAKASGAEARDVGGIMASNPLYPIVPCHRVLGADLSLVGYAGSKGPEALRAKLERLTREAHGFEAERELEVEGRTLKIYPVEWAIAKAEKRRASPGAQQLLFDDWR